MSIMIAVCFAISSLLDRRVHDAHFQPSLRSSNDIRFALAAGGGLSFPPTVVQARSEPNPGRSNGG